MWNVILCFTAKIPSINVYKNDVLYELMKTMLGINYAFK